MRIQFFLGCVILLMIPVVAMAAGPMKISMLPAYAPELINQKVTALASYLGQATGQRFEAELYSDFSQYEKRLKAGTLSVGYQSPAVFVNVADAQQVIAMAVSKAGQARRRGIIITMKNSDIRTLEDLRGKNVSIAGFFASYGYLSQKLTLKAAGIDVETDMNLTEAVDNKGENVILAVYTGEADAGFIHEAALQETLNYVSVSTIKVLATCAWLPNWAVSVNRGLPARLKKEIQAALLDIPADHSVLNILNIKGFRSATDGDYALVKQAVAPAP